MLLSHSYKMKINENKKTFLSIFSLRYSRKYVIPINFSHEKIWKINFAIECENTSLPSSQHKIQHKYFHQ